MTKAVAATRDDIDEVITVVKDFMNITSDNFQTVNYRFDKLEARMTTLEKEMQMTRSEIHKLIARIDSIEKDIEINNDERAVIGMQLTRLHSWVEKAALRIGVDFNR